MWLLYSLISSIPTGGLDMHAKEVHLNIIIRLS